MASYKGRWPLGRGFERFYGFLGGESNSWYPDLVHDNHQVDPPATPEEGYHLAKDLSDRAIEFIRDAKVGRPRQAVLHVPGIAGGPRAAPRRRRVGRQVQGPLRPGLRGDPRAEILARQIELGLLPEGTELSPINPHGEPERTGPDGKPWPRWTPCGPGTR